LRSVVGAGIVDQLEEAIDGGAGVGAWRAGFGLGDVEGVYGHGGLLGGALAFGGDGVGVGGDGAQESLRAGEIVGGVADVGYETAGEFSGTVGGGFNGGAVGAHLGDEHAYPVGSTITATLCTQTSNFSYCAPAQSINVNQLSASQGLLTANPNPATAQSGVMLSATFSEAAAQAVLPGGPTGTVTFTNGASADFNGQPTLSLRTDANGRATLKGFHPNKKEGELAIVVVATLLSLRAEAIIHQQNVSGAAEESNPQQSQQSNSSNSGTSKIAGNAAGSTRRRIVKWTLISAGVAGGIVAVVLLTHNSGGNNITVGPGAVAPP